MYVCVCTFVRVYMQTCIHAYTNMAVRVCVYPCIHTHTHRYSTFFPVIMYQIQQCTYHVSNALATQSMHTTHTYTRIQTYTQLISAPLPTHYIQAHIHIHTYTCHHVYNVSVHVQAFEASVHVHSLHLYIHADVLTYIYIVFQRMWTKAICCWRMWWNA